MVILLRISINRKLTINPAIIPPIKIRSIYNNELFALAKRAASELKALLMMLDKDNFPVSGKEGLVRYPMNKPNTVPIRVEKPIDRKSCIVFKLYSLL